MAESKPPTPTSPGKTGAKEPKRLVEDHIPFVRSIARKLREQVPSIEFDDLVGFGMQGLLEAAKRYDDRHGVAFTTFAYYRVRGAMFDGLRSMGWLPRSEYARVRFEERANSFLQSHADRPSEPGADGKVEERVRDLASTLGGLAAVFVTLLDQRDEASLVDDKPAALDVLERQQLAHRVHRVLGRLPDKERYLIEQYYYHDRTLEQVGESMGLSKSWTSRLHARALGLLREELEAENSGKFD
ncbi:MAG TPA: sigma-70 family RNA polymerase sigma factor [Pseudomonadota bacterium]|nr:sigma-70 family RNA polymerase sigma factor [Pseudomonadota bacterium]